jgi:hypothetical protein
MEEATVAKRGCTRARKSLRSVVAAEVGMGCFTVVWEQRQVWRRALG